ncbi:hypothetical protein IWX90DRAFT_440227 [Phyllosticta citrichinensis]|uniref:Uncharacterized protein n=1 Tax=Phyllosticta citrichinensis TaxID=1130410 RepID=A0ABR1XL11_9PEZI
MRGGRRRDGVRLRLRRVRRVRVARRKTRASGRRFARRRRRRRRRALALGTSRSPGTAMRVAIPLATTTATKPASPSQPQMPTRAASHSGGTAKLTPTCTATRRAMLRTCWTMGGVWRGVIAVVAREVLSFFVAVWCTCLVMRLLCRRSLNCGGFVEWVCSKGRNTCICLRSRVCPAPTRLDVCFLCLGPA